MWRRAESTVAMCAPVLMCAGLLFCSALPPVASTPEQEHEKSQEEFQRHEEKRERRCKKCDLASHRDPAWISLPRASGCAFSLAEEGFWLRTEWSQRNGLGGPLLI